MDVGGGGCFGRSIVKMHPSAGKVVDVELARDRLDGLQADGQSEAQARSIRTRLEEGL